MIENIRSRLYSVTGFVTGVSVLQTIMCFAAEFGALGFPYFNILFQPI